MPQPPRFVILVALVALVHVTAKVALDAKPVKFAVTVFAVKLPVASLATIVEAPLDAAAVVLTLGNTPTTLDCRLQNVVKFVPVPPEVIGKTVPKVSEVK
jgi:hypothetical protein